MCSWVSKDGSQMDSLEQHKYGLISQPVTGIGKPRGQQTNRLLPIYCSPSSGNQNIIVSNILEADCKTVILLSTCSIPGRASLPPQSGHSETNKRNSVIQQAVQTTSQLK